MQACTCRPHRPSCCHELRTEARLEKGHGATAGVRHGVQARGDRPRFGGTPFDLGERLHQQRSHVRIPTAAKLAEHERAVLHVGVRLPHKGFDAVVERPNHRVRIHPKPQGRSATLHVQFAVGVGGQRHALLVEEVGHQGLSAHVRESGVSPRKGQVARHEFVAAVLPIAADSEGRLQVGLLVDGLGVGRAHNAHSGAEKLVAVVVAVDVALRSHLIGNEDVHAAVSAQTPKRERPAPTRGDVKFEGAVLVFGHSTCADVDAQRREDDGG